MWMQDRGQVENFDIVELAADLTYIKKSVSKKDQNKYLDWIIEQQISNIGEDLTLDAILMSKEDKDKPKFEQHSYATILKHYCSDFIKNIEQTPSKINLDPSL